MGDEPWHMVITVPFMHKRYICGIIIFLRFLHSSPSLFRWSVTRKTASYKYMIINPTVNKKLGAGIHPLGYLPLQKREGVTLKAAAEN